jgi:eukaryotic-like serine/threonine-protein kinase
MVNVTSLPKLSEIRYRVANVLGNGAGSTILLISDQESGKQYALKVVKRQDADDDIYVNQAKVEFDVSRRLNHDAIVKIYDLRVKRSWFRVTGVELLMEYVEGKTLDEIEAPALGQLVLIFSRVASALAHMHRRGVYHGDLKPSNIMLSKAGVVKLIDFGTAWIRGEEKNRVQGTPQYMAPEQVKERVVDERTDIYNLGATMYRMFTGRYAQQGIPLLGDSDFRRIIPPNQLQPKMSEKLNALILACLDVNPDRRPAGVSEIKKQLKSIARSLGLDATQLRGADDDD